MPLVNPVLPNDGESADAADISQPFLDLLAVFNGHIGADNLEPGTVPDALGDNSIITTMINDSAVTTSKVADNSITPKKVALRTTVATVTAGNLTPLTSSRAFTVTALDANATVVAPSGTPDDAQSLLIRILDNGSARTLTWNSIYRAVGVTLPTTTVAGKEVYVACVYNSPATKWDVLSIGRLG